MNRIWVVRHGQSLSNSGLPTRGADDNVLTAIGEAQAKHLATAIDTQPDLIVISPYVRTYLTAKPLIAKFPGVPVETWSVQEFTYLSLQTDNLVTREERLPLSIAYWKRCNPNYVHGAGAESFAHLISRAEVTLEKLRQVDGFTVLFSHSTFTKALLWYILENPGQIDESAMRHFQWFHMGFRVPNASILKLNFERDRTVRWSNFHVNHIPSDLRTPRAERAVEVQLADQPS
jgi:broad specificity phosphatase PhoE